MKYLRYILASVVLFAAACKKSSPLDDGNDMSGGQSDIYSFVFTAANNAGLNIDVNGVIGNDTITVELPYGTNLTSLTPEIGYHGSSISPETGVPRNFSSPVHYVVTASNGASKDYIIIVSIHYKSNVFFGTNSGKFYAVDGDSGTYLWSYTPIPYGRIASEATYENNTIYFCTLYVFYALDATTGVLKWSHLLPYYLTGISPIIINNGILYFSTGSSLIALDANTGTEVWNQPASYNYGAPTFSNGLIYCSSDNGSKSFNALTGEPIMSFGNHFTLGNILISGSNLYSGSEGKAIESYNAETGTLNWEFDESQGVGLSGSGCSPTLHNDVVVNGGYNHYMYAVNNTTGQMIWKTNLLILGSPVDANFSAPTVANGLVYSTIGIYTVALDETAGNIVWSTVTSGNPCTVYDHSVLVGGPENTIVSLEAFTGLEKWRYTLGIGDYLMNVGACVVTEDSRVFNSGASGSHQ